MLRFYSKQTYFVLLALCLSLLPLHIAHAAFVAPAEVVSQQEITIAPPNIKRMWTFKLSYIAPENTEVKKGDLLATFDAEKQKRELVEYKSRLQAEIKKKERQILKDAASKQTLILAVAEAEKNEDIARKKADIVDVSRSEIEREKHIAELNIATTLLIHAKQALLQHKHTAQINLDVRDARIAKAKNRVAQTKIALEKLSLYAPEDGIITYVSNGGSKPAVGESIYLGRALMQLPSLDKLAIKVEIDESSIANVIADQKVRVILDEHPEKAFSGVLSKIGKTFRPRSQWDQKVVIDAWVTLDSPDKSIMRPGMKANVEFN